MAHPTHGNREGTAYNGRFARTRPISKAIVEIGQGSSAPDFGRPHPDFPHAPLPRPYAAENGR